MRLKHSRAATSAMTDSSQLGAACSRRTSHRLRQWGERAGRQGLASSGISLHAAAPRWLLSLPPPGNQSVEATRPASPLSTCLFQAARCASRVGASATACHCRPMPSQVAARCTMRTTLPCTRIVRWAAADHEKPAPGTGRCMQHDLARAKYSTHRHSSAWQQVGPAGRCRPVRPAVQ